MSTYGMRESGGAGGWIMGAVTRNPEGLLLLGAGLALLMRSRSSQSGRSSHAEAFLESRGGHQRSGGEEYSATGVGERVGEAARRAAEPADRDPLFPSTTSNRHGRQDPRPTQ